VGASAGAAGPPPLVRDTGGSRGGMSTVTGAFVDAGLARVEIGGRK
jgi:hypothetical protein